MSDIYSTDELSEFLWQLVTVTTGLQQFRDIDARKMNIVVAKLKAGDKLCEAAKKVDKKKLADGLKDLWGVYMDEITYRGDMEKIVGDIDALLESLPDKEEKE